MNDSKKNSLCANCGTYYLKPLSDIENMSEFYNKGNLIAIKPHNITCFCPNCKHTDIIVNPDNKDCKICEGKEDCDMTTLCGKCLGCGRKVKC